MNIAVIPARGGSKRIPRKNVKQFLGRPIISWVLDAAHNCGCFDAVIVSTDDEEIASVAREYGAETPFVRPPELSDGRVGIVPVVAHAADWYARHRTRPDYVCCLFATAPFLEPSDLTSSLEKLIDRQMDYAFSVTEFPFPIQRALRINDDDEVAMFSPEHQNTRSQDLEDAYHDAGQFYWGRHEAWTAQKPLFSNASLAVRLPRIRAQDIDTPQDWEMAERLFHALRSGPA
ncbi:pseudaminic acid cytidylyltransferase [Hoeflea sp. TYP-13]|uniref:pseudaminic acid cytidylyltransferase n=1 Tax=Hoeflea sp. TYP-13 TaxID=3230023 RepID=UPI0034C607F6